jgi:hypothetical protein
MLIPRIQRALVLFAYVLFLSGCSRDDEVLDRFSRAYTAFLNTEYDTRITSLVPIVDVEKQGTYWTELQGALDLHATNKVRREHAAGAINAESNFINTMFDSFSSDLDNLDRAVLLLVEIANSIRNREYREASIAVSQRAREVQSAFASLRTLYSEGFAQRRKVLEKIVADGGVIQPALLFFKQDLVRNAAIATEQKNVEQQLSSTMGRLKDAFSAPTGKAGLKRYPSKWDEDKK